MLSSIQKNPRKSLLQKIKSLLHQNLFLTKKEKEEWTLKVKTFDEIELNGLWAILENNKEQFKIILENKFKKDAALTSKLKKLKKKETKRIHEKVHEGESHEAEDDLERNLKTLK